MVRDMQDNQSFHGPNAGYVLELYDRYLNDPSSLDSEWQGFFATWTPPAEWIGGSTAVVAAEAVTGVDIERVLGARSLADAIRRHGHLAAKLMPIGEHTPDASILEASAHGVSESDLAALPPSVVGGKAAEGAATALEAIEKLRDVYCGTLGYEYTPRKSNATGFAMRPRVAGTINP
jgi:2-oxoglutarate dehydrogenase E1 component